MNRLGGLLLSKFCRLKIPPLFDLSIVLSGFDCCHNILQSFDVENNKSICVPHALFRLTISTYFHAKIMALRESERKRERFEIEAEKRCECERNCSLEISPRRFTTAVL
jgi:hypothetical protein